MMNPFVDGKLQRPTLAIGDNKCEAFLEAVVICPDMARN
jgi:hypothetical protein